MCLYRSRELTVWYIQTYHGCLYSVFVVGFANPNRREYVMFRCVGLCLITWQHSPDISVTGPRNLNEDIGYQFFHNNVRQSWSSGLNFYFIC